MISMIYITELNSENTNHFISSEGVVLVDIKADWCSPCKAISPIIDEISSIYHEKVKVGKLDADANQDFIMDKNIRSIPTILIYKDGVQVEKHVGTINKQRLSEMLDSHL